METASRGLGWPACLLSLQATDAASGPHQPIERPRQLTLTVAHPPAHSTPLSHIRGLAKKISKVILRDLCPLFRWEDGGQERAGV